MTKFSSKLKVQLPLALGLSLISNYSIGLPVLSADQLTTTPGSNASTSPTPDNAKPAIVNTVAIRNIYLNDNKQLVVEFDNPAHLSLAQPQLRDYPGQKHDIVLEFPQTSFAIDKTPKAKAVLDELTKVYPDLNSLSYATASDGTKSRIRIGVSPNVTAHPALAKIDQDSAVINLALSETSKPSVASTDSTVVAKTTPADASKDTPKIASAPDTAAPSQTPDSVKRVKGITKTVNGIKGAWNSSLKAGASINPFSHNKPVSKQSTPGPTDIATTTASNEKPTTPVKEENSVPSVSSNSLPITTEPLAASTPISSSVPITAELPAATTPPAVSELSPTKKTPTASSTNLTSGTASIAANPTSEIASLKPEIKNTEEIKSTEVLPVNKDNQLAVTDTNKTKVESTKVENTKSELTRISANPEEIKPSDEPVITPLSIEQAMKEKASMEAANPKPPSPETDNIVRQPISTESKTADNSFASDFKTGFSKPDETADKKDVAEKSDKSVAEKPDNESIEKKVVSEKTDNESAEKNAVAEKPDSQSPEKIVVERLTTEDKKEDSEKVASLPPNPLDSLTSAAINNAGDEPAAETDAQTSAAVKLKAQKAHAGGKDYFPPKFDDEAIEHYNAAVRAHLSGKLTEAITEYKAAIDADEKIAEAYSNLGLIYNQLHKYDQAMVEFHKALAINPKDAITYNGIGAAMRAKNNLVAAIKNWQTAISLDPNLASAHYNLGTAFEINKDLDKALSQYKEAVKHDDKLGEAYYRMGLILQKMNNKNLALEDYKQAIKISQQASYAPDAKRRINLLSQSKNNAM